MNTNKKLIAWMTLLTGLSVSAIAIFYSVVGLAAIFAAAVIPIVIMGVVLEVGKLVATIWLKTYWNEAPKLIKYYLITAVTILMLITSMGIFGFLSKAHSDQTLISGDVTSKIAFIDERIKVQEDNIASARKDLSQLDSQVNETLKRTATQENNSGVDRSVAIRKQQAKERTDLQKSIQDSQTQIANLRNEKAPIAAEVRKIEAEVGPIKYIAAIVYGEKPDTNILEKAVSWVIIIIVAVFDPLAIVLLLASQHSFALLTKQEPPQSEDEEAPQEDPKPEEPQVITDASIPIDNDNFALPGEDLEKIKKWKAENPDQSMKRVRAMHKAGTIKKLPWH